MESNLIASYRDLVIEHGDALYNTEDKVKAILQDAAVGERVLIWERTIPAQVIEVFGSGTPAMPRNQGFAAFCALDNDSAANGGGFVVGIVQLWVANAPRTQQQYLTEISTGRMHIGPWVTGKPALDFLSNDIDRQATLPEQAIRAAEDSKLQIWFETIKKPTTVESVAWRIPSTRYTALQ